MNPSGAILNYFAPRLGILALALFGGAIAVGAESPRPPVNEFGAAVHDANGTAITYSREEVAAMAEKAGVALDTTEPQQPNGPQGFVGPSGVARPFWQYAIF